MEYIEKYRNNISEKINAHVDEKRSKEIEKIIYETAISFCVKNNITTIETDMKFIMIYLEISRGIIDNINPSSYIQNKTLLNLIKSDKFKLENITKYYKTSKKWKNYKNDIDILNSEKTNINPDMASTDQFTCRKCKKSKCCYFTLQTRSADEATSCFITCLECSHNWKE